MKPLLHAKISCKKFGGKPEDYIEIHDFIDSTKAHIADSRHRIVLHNSFGVFICEKVFGEISQKADGSYVRMPYITNSDGKQISVRDIAEQHIIDDLGCIPSLSDILNKAQLHEDFVGGISKRKIIINPKNIEIVD